MTYTQGPWKWFNYQDGRKLLCAEACAVIHCPDSRMGIDPADADLIASAPDLYEALKDLVAVIEADDLIPETVAHMRQARTALAKAEGRSA